MNKILESLQYSARKCGSIQQSRRSMPTLASHLDYHNVKHKADKQFGGCINLVCMLFVVVAGFGNLVDWATDQAPLIGSTT